MKKTYVKLALAGAALFVVTFLVASFANQTLNAEKALLLRNVVALADGETNVKWGMKADTKKIYIGKDYTGTSVYLVFECCASAESQYTGCSTALKNCDDIVL